jgi:hypothetical protein
MSVLKYARFALIAAIFLFMPHIELRAQDDETPEQRRVMQTLMEREQIAAEERSGAANYTSPEAQLMQEKESNRAGMIREEENEVTENSEGGWQERWY